MSTRNRSKRMKKMLSYRFSLALLFSVCLFVIGAPVFAQSEYGQWIGELYLVDIHSNAQGKNHFFLIDEKDNIHKKIPNLSDATKFPVPQEFLKKSFQAFWRNNALYMLGYGEEEKNEDGSSLKRWTLAKWEDDEWHFLGNYKTDTRGLLTAIPCDNDRFIVVSSFSDLTNNNRWDRTPFHIMSIPSGKTELRIVSPIDHGQDKLRKYMSDPDCFKLAWLSKVIMTDKYAILINSSTGLYWIFSLEKASLIKANNIFKNAEPEWIAKGGFYNLAVLCANPEKDGTVLVSTLDEDLFVNKGLEPLKLDKIDEVIIDEYVNNYPDVDPILEEKVRKIWAFRRAERVAKFQYIVWYRIYPENGKVEKLPGFPEGGTLFRDGGNDIWRPMPDGSVKMGWESAFALRDAVEEKMKKAEKDNPAEKTKKEPGQSITAQSKGDNPPSKNDK